MTRPLPRNQILVGDALQQLRRLPPDSVDMVLTSPPYFRLRNYGAADQIGLEPCVDDWARRLLAVARETARLLTPGGSLWLNLADTYAAHLRQGAARKSLLLGPERVLLALVADGWMVRNKIIWAKPNPMPTSVADRLTCSYELVYVLVRSHDYFFDLDAIRLPHRTRPRPTGGKATDQPDASWRGPNTASTGGLRRLKAQGLPGHPLGKNPSDVWNIAPSRYRSAHHATFPLALAERAITAGCPEARCRSCRQAYRRTTLRALGARAVRGALTPRCDCDGSVGTERGIVLDPFFGAGTTAVAAVSLGRDWLGVELNPQFAAVAADRLKAAHLRASPPAATARSP